MDDQHTTEEHDHWIEAMWRSFLTGGDYDFSATPLHLRLFGGLQKSVFRALPANPRCRDCYAPFRGIGGLILWNFGYGQSDLTPRLCDSCLRVVRQMQGGAEVELSMLFADVRGSTTLAEQIGPMEFQRLINRFYTATTAVLIEHNAFVDRLQGDEVIGLFVPGFAGTDHAAVAVQAAQDLLHATGHADPDGPWITVGAGVHTGVAYVGAVGSAESLSDITALGDAVNTAARLASQAAPGEIVVSEATLEAAAIDAQNLEERALELKGKSESVGVRIMRVEPG